MSGASTDPPRIPIHGPPPWYRSLPPFSMRPKHSNGNGNGEQVKLPRWLVSIVLVAVLGWVASRVEKISGDLDNVRERMTVVEVHLGIKAPRRSEGVGR